MTQPLPHAAGTVDLVTMSSVLHVLDEPLPVLAEIRRVLGPGGVFMLHDWIRQPLQAYLAWRRDELKERGPEMLAEAGLTIRDQTQLRASHQIFVTTPAV